jgi:hypothetical protein
VGGASLAEISKASAPRRQAFPKTLSNPAAAEIDAVMRATGDICRIAADCKELRRRCGIAS